MPGRQPSVGAPGKPAAYAVAYLFWLKVCRFKIWNDARWMWIGWASAVRLTISHTSTSPSRGNSEYAVVIPFNLIETKSLYSRGELPDVLVLLTRISTGPPGYLVFATPVTGSVAFFGGSRTSLSVSWRVLLTATPAASVPVAGAVSRAIGWFSRIAAFTAGSQLVSSGHPAAGQFTRNWTTSARGPTGFAPAG